ncbi:MAG: hypothetical protein LBH43_14175 [Treponema sp.]|nr:hypothetical protein [Treponema sp.]
MYSGPIVINKSANLKAADVKDGINNSLILTAVYTLPYDYLDIVDQFKKLERKPINKICIA